MTHPVPTPPAVPSREEVITPKPQPIGWLPKVALDRLNMQAGTPSDPLPWCINTVIYSGPVKGAVPVYALPAGV